MDRQGTWEIPLASAGKSPEQGKPADQRARAGGEPVSLWSASASTNQQERAEAGSETISDRRCAGGKS